MPLQWKVSHLDHMVICVSEGAVTLKDFQEYLAALKQEKGAALSQDIRCDPRPVRNGQGDRRKLVALLTSFLEIDGLGPFAVVAGSQRNYGLISVFRSLATVKRPMRLFPDIHAARKWLNTRSSS